jgi:hypothetical protein
MTQHLDSLLQKEMSRKEFLLTMGLAVGSILGFSQIIHLLTGKTLSSHSSRSSSGYGSSPYGR